MDQKSQQARAAALRGLRILTLLKRFTSQAFSGIVLHGTDQPPAPPLPKQQQQQQGQQQQAEAPSYGPLQTLEAGPWGVRVRFRVPPHLCSGGSSGADGEDGGGYYLTCGAIMAWFDEVSSWAFICAHPRHRPGVSVSLTATVLRWARAGQVVELESRVYKTGETLGFADVTLKDAETGREMAHGRHVKYLIMGRAWDLAMHPLIFPFAHYFARRACDRAAFAPSPLLLLEDGGKPQTQQRDGRDGGANGNGTKAAAAASAPAPAPAVSAPPASIHLDGLLGLEGFVLTDDGAAAATGPATNPARPPPPILKATARVRVVGRLCNNFDTLHGGAVSILAERMAARVWAAARRMAGWSSGSSDDSSSGSEDDDEEQAEGAVRLWPHARTCSIDFMSPAPKGREVVLEAWAAPLGASPSPSPWPAAVPSSSSAPAPYPPLTGIPQPAAADDVGPNGGGDGGSWLPTPGLVRVWFRCGDRTLTQCHVQFDPPPRPPPPALHHHHHHGQQQPASQPPPQAPQQQQPVNGGGKGSKRARRWSRL